MYICIKYKIILNTYITYIYILHIKFVFEDMHAMYRGTHIRMTDCLLKNYKGEESGAML